MWLYRYSYIQIKRILTLCDRYVDLYYTGVCVCLYVGWKGQNS